MPKKIIDMSKIILTKNSLKDRLCQTSLSIDIYYFEDCLVTKCPQLDLSACGLNLSEAIRNISVSISMFISSGLESGELKEWLMELGWEITDSKLEYNGEFHQVVEFSNGENRNTITLPIKEFLVNNDSVVEYA